MVRSDEDRGFQHLVTPPSKTGRSRVLGRSRFGVVEDVLEDLFADGACRASDHDPSSSVCWVTHDLFSLPMALKPSEPTILNARAKRF